MALEDMVVDIHNYAGRIANAADRIANALERIAGAFEPAQEAVSAPPAQPEVGGVVVADD